MKKTSSEIFEYKVLPDDGEKGVTIHRCEEPCRKHSKADVMQIGRIVIAFVGMVCAVCCTVGMILSNVDLVVKAGSVFWLMMTGERILKLVEETE